MIVGNPTARAKAVRIAGGHVIIEPGKTETFDDALSDADVARYKAVGLTFPTAKAKADAAVAQPVMPSGKK
jgi:hypothetical protein